MVCVLDIKNNILSLLGFLCFQMAFQDCKCMNCPPRAMVMVFWFSFFPLQTTVHISSRLRLFLSQSSLHSLRLPVSVFLYYIIAHLLKYMNYDFKMLHGCPHESKGHAT